jgi:hypothetical protein
LIPEFSLPGTSIGTEEAEIYLKLRSECISQSIASKLFLPFGLNIKYGISLEKRYRISNKKSNALFTDPQDVLHKPEQKTISIINRLFLSRGCNPLYFSRNNILRIREIKQGFHLPLNKQGYNLVTEVLNSS